MFLQVSMIGKMDAEGGNSSRIKSLKNLVKFYSFIILYDVSSILKLRHFGGSLFSEDLNKLFWIVISSS